MKRNSSSYLKQLGSYGNYFASISFFVLGSSGAISPFPSRISKIFFSKI